MMQYSILLGLRLANLVYDLPYLKLSVKLLPVQAPNVRSIDSKIPGVARLSANILDISANGRDFGISTTVFKTTSRNVGATGGTVRSTTRSRCAGVLAFEAVSSKIVAHIRSMIQGGTRHAQMLHATLRLSLQAWTQMQHALDPVYFLVVVENFWVANKSRNDCCKCRKSKDMCTSCMPGQWPASRLWSSGTNDQMTKFQGEFTCCRKD